MFFGLTNFPATFQMMMNTIFQKEVTQGWLSVYMDDNAIHTKPKEGEMKEEHTKHHQSYVHHVLEALEKNDLYLKPEKCEFKKQEIKYLRVIVGQNLLQMDPKKLQSVAEWAPPKNPTEIRQFLEFTGYYRYFVPNYSKIACPLLDLTKKLTTWQWEQREIQAFQALKKLMCESPILTQPDFKKRFYLQMDASAYSMDAILS